MSPELHHIFIYGSLLRGEPSHDRLGSSRFLGLDRTTEGYGLVDLGPYPAMVLQPDGAVQGELYELDSATLAQLDVFEEHPTVYQRRAVELASGARAEAYLLPEERAQAFPLIPSGNWRTWRQRFERS